ncbi:calcium-binding protein CML27 [Tripterygium wilfordii]|uniref:Calcium-binding protein CML27 n=1 Tax=Tripterygium wilfordii TaxID=458696 RepID=A0A7J7C843_TRIWF|nr:calcium-binding protein CML27 [Tripterygium wilfordii]
MQSLASYIKKKFSENASKARSSAGATAWRLGPEGKMKLTLPEFAHLCRTTSNPAQELRYAFDLYDQDKNGLISSSELHLVLNRLGIKCSVDDCVKMIRSVDSDGDGNVNFQEFEKMMSNKLANGSGS